MAVIELDLHPESFNRWSDILVEKLLGGVVVGVKILVNPLLGPSPGPGLQQFVWQRIGGFNICPKLCVIVIVRSLPSNEFLANRCAISKEFLANLGAIVTL